MLDALWKKADQFFRSSKEEMAGIFRPTEHNIHTTDSRH